MNHKPFAAVSILQEVTKKKESWFCGECNLSVEGDICPKCDRNDTILLAFSVGELLSAYIYSLESCIQELLEELNPTSRTDHKVLSDKALQLLGLNANQRKLYYMGELIL